MYRQETRRINELKDSIPRQKNAERRLLMEKRLAMAHTKRDLAEKQIVQLRRHL